MRLLSSTLGQVSEDEAVAGDDDGERNHVRRQHHQNRHDLQTRAGESITLIWTSNNLKTHEFRRRNFIFLEVSAILRNIHYTT